MSKKLVAILSTTLIMASTLHSKTQTLTFEETVVPGYVIEEQGVFSKIRDRVFESMFHVPDHVVFNYNAAEKIRLENEIQALKDANVDFLYWATSGLFDQPVHSKDLTKSYKRIKDKYLTYDLFDASISANMNPFDNQYQLTMKWDF